MEVEATTPPKDETMAESNADVVPSSSSEESLGKAKAAMIFDENELNSFWQVQFKRMARNPCIHLGVCLGVSVLLSALAMTVGGFEATVDNAGWQSRGTLIANRQTQLQLTETYQNELFFEGQEAWEDLLNNVQPGWETGSFGNERRRLDAEEVTTARTLPMNIDSRLLQQATELEGCDTSWYNNTRRMQRRTHLWPIWKATNMEDTLLAPELFLDICVAEQNTQEILEAEGLCFGCEDGCLPPYSVVLYARLVIEDGFSLDCQELSDQWAQYQTETETQWAQCVSDIKDAFDPSTDNPNPESCPDGFFSAFVEESFDSQPQMMLTSSIFATTEEDVDALYEIVDRFDRGSDKVLGAYDTQFEDFGILFSDAAVGKDMALACGSAVITTTAMIIHTKSPLITGVGLLQVILSFPLSYFVYTFFGQLDFFPFLNFIGVFVVFALGADNIFVATDKWKNARLKYPTASVEYIAAIALPDAAGAMFLTMVTTAIAFFGTAICPVAPIKMFAIFCGLLIMFDYLLCVLLVFPALCIYGRRLEVGTARCCTAFNFRKQDEDEDASEKESFIRKVLTRFHEVLHKVRFGLLAACAIGFGISIYFATTLELPTSSDVRILQEDIQYEQNYLWRKSLLNDYLRRAGGARVAVGFGLSPADTGDINNPDEWSQLVLDPTFDPSSTEAQEFLLNFCPNMFDQDFATLPSEDYSCPFNRFASWVEEEAAAENPSEAYESNCGGATSVPVPEENFHDCIIAWSLEKSDTRVLSYENEVKIIFFGFSSSVRFDSPFDDLDREWNAIENWFNSVSSDAPEGVSKSFYSNQDFWWYDTNKQMLGTAYGAAGIALGAAALVILFSSRSFTLTLFAVLTIGYVLTSVTATLVGFGWTLGFLESICFAILIGVSVDFVIHFTHSYAHMQGEHTKSDRTKHALIQMGPSILAAAFTTIAAAIIMLFTVISFFRKFALILFMTIVQATVGSFLVFLVMAECFGPSNPTALFDMIRDKFRKKESTSEENES